MSIQPVRRRRSRGQALVEFALVIPVFFMLLFGLIDLGHFVYVSNALNQAAREAARVGSVAGFTQDCSGVPSRAQCIQQVAVGRMAGTPTPTVTSGCSRIIGTGPITVGADQCRAGDRLTVRLTTPYSMYTPVIAQLVGTTMLTGQAIVTVNN